MSRPIIGITVDTSDKPNRYESPIDYARSVELAGGLPILLPYHADFSLIPQYADLIDGMLFTGGNDLDPTRWGEELHPMAVPIDPPREKFEMALLAEVESRRIPTLGICLGSQLMNVHRGGTLHQFLPDYNRDDPLEHRRMGKEILRHPVTLEGDSRIGRAIGKPEISVNTYHKQSVAKLGRGLRVIAKAPDGVVEGFEDPSYPLFAAVQWHPERMVDESEHLALFKLLVEESRKD